MADTATKAQTTHKTRKGGPSATRKRLKLLAKKKKRRAQQQQHDTQAGPSPERVAEAFKLLPGLRDRHSRALRAVSDHEAEINRRQNDHPQTEYSMAARDADAEKLAELKLRAHDAQVAVEVEQRIIDERDAYQASRDAAKIGELLPNAREAAEARADALALAVVSYFAEADQLRQPQDHYERLRQKHEKARRRCAAVPGATVPAPAEPLQLTYQTIMRVKRSEETKPYSGPRDIHALLVRLVGAQRAAEIVENDGDE